jgi:RNA polymerase sigma factor FliA
METNDMNQQLSKENIDDAILEYSQTKDFDLRNRIVNYYLPYIEKIGKLTKVRYLSYIYQDVSIFEREDAIQEAAISFMKELEELDPNENLKPDYFMQEKMKCDIIDEEKKHRPLKRRDVGKIKKLNKIENKLLQQLQRKPTLVEIVNYNGFTQDEVSKIRILRERSTIQLSNLEREPYKETDNPEELAVRKEYLDVFQKGIEFMNKRDQELFQLYYLENKTMKEIANYLGIVDTRVCQLLKNNIPHLRERMKKSLGYDHKIDEKARHIVYK